jgi:hypothetical protein
MTKPYDPMEGYTPPRIDPVTGGLVQEVERKPRSGSGGGYLIGNRKAAIKFSVVILAIGIMGLVVGMARYYFTTDFISARFVFSLIVWFALPLPTAFLGLIAAIGRFMKVSFILFVITTGISLITFNIFLLPFAILSTLGAYPFKKDAT